MFKFITKEMYWNALATGVENNLRKGVFPWHLKSIQDVMVANFLKDFSKKIIAEVGGGDSRILPWLAKENEVYNIERFEGLDGGPTNRIEFNNVKNIYCWVGESDSFIDDNYFDIIFSVSVVEHVPNEKVKGFIEDLARILKPGGIMFHAVDIYLPDKNYAHDGAPYVDYVHSRLLKYLEAFSDGRFSPLEAPEIKELKDVSFHPSYCTNPDNIMKVWNDVSPSLKTLRANAQSGSILWAGTKK